MQEEKQYRTRRLRRGELGVAAGGVQQTANAECDQDLDSASGVLLPMGFITTTITRGKQQVVNEACDLGEAKAEHLVPP